MRAVLAVDEDSAQKGRLVLIALQLMQLVLFFRMSSPTLMLDSTWASLDVSIPVFFICLSWFWVMAVSSFRLSHRQAEYQFSLFAAVICAQDHHCCRRLVGYDCQKSWLMGWLTHSAAGLLVAGLKWALHLCPP